MKKFSFFVRRDAEQEAISSVSASTRLEAAKHFAQVKRLSLKNFLALFGVKQHDK